MDAEKNKPKVRRWQEAYNTGNLDALDEVLAPDWRSNSWPDQILPKSVENAKVLHRMRLQIFPDRRHTTEDIIAEVDRVVQRFTFAGTHRHEFFGLMPNGKRFESAAINIFRIDAGKIVDWARAKAGLNRAILDASPGELRRQLAYRCEWYGSSLVVAGPWFPSSKTCSSCKTVNSSCRCRSGRFTASPAAWSSTGTTTPR